MCVREGVGGNCEQIKEHPQRAGAMKCQEKPEGHVHNGPHTPEPNTALGEGAVTAKEVKSLTLSETPGISWCFVREHFLFSTPICFPAK